MVRRVTGSGDGSLTNDALFKYQINDFRRTEYDQTPPNQSLKLTEQMKRTNRLKFIRMLCCPIVLFMWESSIAQPPARQYERVKNDLLSLKSDETKIAHVKNIQLKRDAGVFTFTSGTFYALSPVNGKVHGLLFLGDGEFVCTPPTEVERKQFTDSMERKFSIRK